MNVRKSGLETRVQSDHTKAFEWKRKYKKERGGDWSTDYFIQKLLSRSVKMKRKGVETGVQVYLYESC